MKTFINLGCKHAVILGIFGRHPRKLAGFLPSIISVEHLHIPYQPQLDTFARSTHNHPTLLQFWPAQIMSYKKIADSVSVNSASEDLELNHSSSRLIFEPGEITYLQQPEDAPQGRHLGLYSTIILFVSRILGSGFLANASGMYIECGQSPFYFVLSWIVAAVLAFSGCYVFLELGSLIPRSGGTKVFLEYIYEKPYMFASVVFSLYSVMFGFTILNLLVFGEYFLHALGIEATAFKTRATGLIFLYITCAIHGLSTHHGVRVQNFVGGLKLILALVIVVSCSFVIVAPSSITNIENQLDPKDFFAVKTKITVSSFSNAVIRGCFAYGGWNAIHTVSNEIKDPVRTLKIAAPVSLSIITLTYVTINLAYLVVIPGEEIVNGGQLVGSLLFERMFGFHVGKQLLTMSAALCAGGNVFVVMYTISRTSQEVFREGFLPFSLFMASNWPYDAPLATLLLSSALSTLVIVSFPDGDVYSYVVSLESYPQQIFIALCGVGLFIIHRRHPGLVAPIKSPVVGTILMIFISVYPTITPLLGDNPNPTGMEDWIPYTYLGLFCVFLCVAYWAGMFLIKPFFGGYTLVPLVLQHEDGLKVKEWHREPNA